MKNTNILIILITVIALASVIFVSAQYKKAQKEAKQPKNTIEIPKEVPKTDDTVKLTRINISNFSFAPPTLIVKPGENIEVINKDSVAHSLTSDSNLFDTGLLEKDAKFIIKAPIKPGSYTYFCKPHPNMKGAIVVEE